MPLCNLSENHPFFSDLKGCLHLDKRPKCAEKAAFSLRRWRTVLKTGFVDSFHHCMTDQVACQNSRLLHKNSNISYKNFVFQLAVHCITIRNPHVHASFQHTHTHTHTYLHTRLKALLLPTHWHSHRQRRTRAHINRSMH